MPGRKQSVPMAQHFVGGILPCIHPSGEQSESTCAGAKRRRKRTGEVGQAPSVQVYSSKTLGLTGAQGFPQARGGWIGEMMLAKELRAS